MNGLGLDLDTSTCMDKDSVAFSNDSTYDKVENRNKFKSVIREFDNSRLSKMNTSFNLSSSNINTSIGNTSPLATQKTSR